MSFYLLYGLNGSFYLLFGILKCIFFLEFRISGSLSVSVFEISDIQNFGYGFGYPKFRISGFEHP
ncbi:hypothetical protein Hanom_Chr06g00564731 [Helianthus anomalus]